MSNEPVSLKGAKVMVVDDVKENLELMTKVLEMEGYEVSFAMNGEKAIKLANLEPPDLILLDVMMPGIDGFETCRRLKSVGATRDIPIIFVTGKADLQSVVEGFQIGAVDYITKPIQQEEVSVRVKTHLQLQSLVQIRDDLIVELKQHIERNKEFMEIQRKQLIEAEKGAELGELVGQLCHELGTPVGSAITASTASLQQISVVKEKMQAGTLGKKDLDKMLTLNGEGQSIIKSNLEYAVNLMSSFKQVTVDQFSGQKTTFEIAEYISHVINILKPRMKNTPHKVEIHCGKQYLVDSYPGALSQLIINLVNNSMLHGFTDDKAGTISIDVHGNEDNIIIDYRDDGKGISSDQLEHIFKKYYTTAKSKGGSGLGLFIVKQIVEDNLSGKLTCESKAGEGVHFCVELPLKENATMLPTAGAN